FGRGSLHSISLSVTPDRKLSISSIRQRISPWNKWTPRSIRKLKDSLSVPEKRERCWAKVEELSRLPTGREVAPGGCYHGSPWDRLKLRWSLWCGILPSPSRIGGSRSMPLVRVGRKIACLTRCPSLSKN